MVSASRGLPRGPFPLLSLCAGSPRRQGRLRRVQQRRALDGSGLPAKAAFSGQEEKAFLNGPHKAFALPCVNVNHVLGSDVPVSSAFQPDWTRWKARPQAELPHKPSSTPTGKLTHYPESGPPTHRTPRSDFARLPDHAPNTALPFCTARILARPRPRSLKSVNAPWRMRTAPLACG